ncbi:DUF1566 domain-containing protein [Aquidulcibacter sp.]|uniref:Lcl C-terminal domain-containing protein n=1 Tax=Aquidulcibacter sp. TaxID=2052990 RepID=UPI0025BBDFCF|nr:DUF1566 domain-containing protein [Aquidulcibacter sp.]MCA3694501.1 DUF1566 domain-containing protein [Aquidulcibacter sp.]
MSPLAKFRLGLGLLVLCLLQVPASAGVPRAAGNYQIVSTGQDRCYDVAGPVLPCPAPGLPLSGQNAQHPGKAASYRVEANNLVVDEITGLMWAKTPSAPMTFKELASYARASRLGGYDDWRVPTIKELYSLIDYRGGYTGDPATSRPYIDTKYFDFAYGDGKGLGDAAHGRRPIDVQEWSATPYVGKTMGRDDTVFGVNFADGRIKGYPVMDPANRMQTPNRLAVRLVRGNPYGQNAFKARPDVVEDHATGLMWQRKNDGTAKSWSAALSYCTHLSLAGYSDWRLPHAKELHSLVDYNRIPAIDPLFQLSDQTAYLWSSTTHLEGPPPAQEQGRAFSQTGELAVYAAIGKAQGFMEVPPGSGQRRWLDVHGAGAMRSDPKTASPGSFPEGFGPQGDDIRGHNYVLCVRDLR